MKRSRHIRFIVSLILILLGILLNEWMVAWLFIPDGRIDAVGLRLLLWISSLLCIAGGVFLAWHQPRAPRRRGAVGISALATLLALVGAEVLLRLLGFQAWTPVTLMPHARETSGQRLYQADAVTGYTLRPGRFEIRLPSGHTFAARHLPNGTRAAHPVHPDTTLLSTRAIWIFGDSFPYGWSLNDQDTFAWLTQQRLPRYRIANLGVPGYSTVQAYYRFQETLAQSTKPALIVLVYASFSDARNTLARAHRKQIAYQSQTEELGTLTLPKAALVGDSLALSRERLFYRAVPLARHSALFNLIDNAVNVIEQHALQSQHVSRAMLRMFAETAQQQGIAFVVAGITDDPTTRDLLSYCQQEGMSVLDLAVDLTRPAYTNLPHDAHPSAAAHAIYAERLTSFITTLYDSPRQTP